MNRTEAAQILEIDINATPAQINTAYRKSVAKYHPDANRNKPETERKRAEELFKKCAKAKQIMLAPPEPEPEPEPVVTHRTPNNTHTYNTAETAHTTTNTQSNSTSTHKYGEQFDPRTNQYYSPKRETHVTNSAKTFVGDNIPRVPDPQETQIATFYNKEAKKRYSSKTDLIRVTPSIVISIIYLILSAIIISMTGGTNDMTQVLTNPLTIFGAAMIGKILIYDTLLSYYVNKLFKNMKTNWIIQCGVESILVLLCYMALSIIIIGSFNGMLLIGGIVISVLSISAGIVTTIISKNRLQS